MKAYVCAFQDRTGGWFGMSSAGRSDQEVQKDLRGLLTKTPQQRQSDDGARSARIEKIMQQYKQPADAFRGPNKERKAFVKRLLSDSGFLTLCKRWQEQEDGLP